MPTVVPALRIFAPERWEQVDGFEKFWSTTYTFDAREQRVVTGVRAHFEKCRRLASLALKLRPNLEIDRAQLEERGFSEAENAAELATVIEAAILELYSSVDCTVKVLRAVYGPGTRGFKDSTRGLFQGVGKLTGTFPEELKPTFAVAPWYWRLVHLRDELTHRGTGQVYADPETGHVIYRHLGVMLDDKPLFIADVFGWLKEMVVEVNCFLGAVFHHLNCTLEDKPVMQLCGMVEGRMLHRYLRPVGVITFDSGECGAWIWFEKPENPTCPFKDHCGAYLNKAPPPPE